MRVRLMYPHLIGKDTITVGGEPVERAQIYFFRCDCGTLHPAPAREQHMKRATCLSCRAQASNAALQGIAAANSPGQALSPRAERVVVYASIGLVLAALSFITMSVANGGSRAPAPESVRLD